MIHELELGQVSLSASLLFFVLVVLHVKRLRSFPPAVFGPVD